VTPTVGESASLASVAYGTSTVLSMTGLPAGASGTVTFTAPGPITLCTVTLPATSCDSLATLPVDSYAVTASYPGDGNVNSATSSTASFQVAQAHPTLTESAGAVSIPFGSTTTLTASGLPAGATGTITFTESDPVTLCVATLPARSCTTSPNLTAGTFAVTATYSGDSNVAAAQATGITLLQAEPDLPGTGVPALGIAGAGLCLLIAGLGALATARRLSNRRAGAAS
jgi:hypothetical protein